MSMIEELFYFIGLQIKQCKKITFLNQAKYIVELLKRYDVFNLKIFGTPMNPSLMLYFDPNGKKMWPYLKAWLVVYLSYYK